MNLTPERLAAVYTALRAFPPFCRWQLPPAPEVTFRVVKCRDCVGYYDRDRRGDNYTISVSESLVGHFDTLAPIVAHEMLHLYQDVAGTETPNASHNAEFHKLSANICRQMGWDRKFFVL